MPPSLVLGDSVSNEPADALEIVALVVVIVAEVLLKAVSNCLAHFPLPSCANADLGGSTTPCRLLK